MRPFLVLVGAMASVSAFTQTITLDAFQSGKKAGTVQYTRSIQGGMQTNVTKINTVQKGTPTALVLTSIFDAKGNMLSRRFQAHAGPHSVDVKASFTGGAAKVVIVEDGKTTSHTFQSSSKASTTDLTTWWFITTKPKPGAVVQYQSFDVATLKWEDIESTYVGRKAVTVGKKTVTANQILQKRPGRTSTIYVDDKALPLVIEQATTRFVRRS